MQEPRPSVRDSGDDPETAPVSRRALLGAGAAAAALACTSTRSQAGPRTAAPTVLVRRAGRAVLVGSANGLAGMRAALPLLEGGADPLEAALAVVRPVEADPSDSSVGLGGLPNERGVVQLDAAVMHGPTHNAGAVACLEDILHPSEVARLVMERTDHCLLVGRGAYEFARAHGHPHADLLTEPAREAWLRWKELLSEEDEWLPPAQPRDRRSGRLERGARVERARLAAVREVLGEAALEHVWGTIHCSALAPSGDVACTTTTSGLAFKIPGRVGDSPLIGAGLYCDQEAGSAGATGRGEAAILAGGSFALVEALRAGRHPKDAGLEVLGRIARQVERQARWQPGLLAEDGRPSFGIQFYALGLDGSFAGVTLKGPPARFAVADADGVRHETLEPLLA